MKQCCTCKETKELSEFHKAQNLKDGLAKRCKTCVKEACSLSYQKHKKARTLKAKQSYYANKEHRMVINKRSYEKHKEARLAKAKEWRENNRGLRRAYKEARLEAEANRTPSWADMKRINARYTLAKYLTELDGRQRHVDHIIPLRGELVSGLHVADNLQILYAEDNLRKSNYYEVI